MRLLLAIYKLPLDSTNIASSMKFSFFGAAKRRLETSSIQYPRRLSSEAWGDRSGQAYGCLSILMGHCLSSYFLSEPKATINPFPV